MAQVTLVSPSISSLFFAEFIPISPDVMSSHLGDPPMLTPSCATSLNPDWPSQSSVRSLLSLMSLSLTLTMF